MDAIPRRDRRGGGALRAPGGFERHVPAIRYDMLDTLVGYALRRAQIAIYEDFARALAGTDITPQRFAALVIIAANPAITQAMLGRVMGIAGSGVVALIDRLERAGLVARRAASRDRRASALGLTAKGRRRLGALKARVAAHDARISSALGAEERASLVRLLDRLG